MHLSGVRPSSVLLSLSVRHIRAPLLRVCCCETGGQEISIYCCTAGGQQQQMRAVPRCQLT